MAAAADIIDEKRRRVGLIGFPIDLGGNMRGVDMGPSAIRLSGFAERLESMGVDVTDMGNVLVHTRALIDQGDSSARHLEEILRASDECARMTEAVVQEGLLPVALGGDHTVVVGMLWGMAKLRGPGGIIWIDAHADLNTPRTSPSGNVHGMSLAMALGLCTGDSRFQTDEWPERSLLPEHTVLIGTRDLDPGEAEYLRQPGSPTVFTMSEVDRHGVSTIIEQALAITADASFLHVSLDMDAVDPHDAPGVGTPLRGGLTYREAHMLLETVATADFSSVDVVEVNPVLDTHNSTAVLAGELICSLFGERIL